MAITFPATITGAAQTGFTTPTYTTTADSAPDVNAKQVTISAIGGTQAGVVVHSVSSPFTISYWRPKVLALLGKANPTTGLIDKVPNNTYKCITRKGVVPASGQPAKAMVIRTEIDVPAGTDSYDIANVRAAISAHMGLVWAQAAGIGDTANTGTI